MDFMEQQYQESKHIEEELVTLNSKILCLLEYIEVINVISVNLPSQFLIYKITKYFE